MAAGPGRPRALVELIAIGDELLLGDGLDSNSAWISRRLAEIGLTVVRHTTVGDGITEMTAALQEAFGRADVVLTTGGLGPTQDDLTRQAVARVAGVPLVRDEDMVVEIAEFFASRGRDMPSTNEQQADLPAGGTWLSRVGSAPGFRVEVDGRVIACMPGVPREMRVMLADDVVPLLARRFGAATTVSRLVRTAGRSESGIAADLAELAAEADRRPELTLAFLATKGETRVKVTASGADRDEALAITDPVVEQVVELLGDGVVGLDDEGTEHAVARLLLAHGWTLGVAESITGGGVGARLVRVPGASDWFRGGLTTYATEVKTTLAGLDPASLADPTDPVSEGTARALAASAASVLGADVGLGIVGVAGPDPVGDVPAGRVQVVVQAPGGRLVTRQVDMPATQRGDVLDFAVSAALAVLVSALREQG